MPRGGVCRIVEITPDIDFNVAELNEDLVLVNVPQEVNEVTTI